MVTWWQVMNVTNLVISHEREKDREVFTTSGKYPWSSSSSANHQRQLSSSLIIRKVPKDTKGVISSHKSKDRQYSGLKKKNERTSNDILNTRQKTTDRGTRTSLKLEVNSYAPEGKAVPASLWHSCYFCCKHEYKSWMRKILLWLRQMQHSRGHLWHRFSRGHLWHRFAVSVKPGHPIFVHGVWFPFQINIIIRYTCILMTNNRVFN